MSEHNKTEPLGVGASMSEDTDPQYNWHANATAGQLPPPGRWSLWVVLGERGSGLTRTGAEQVRIWAQEPDARIAIVGRTPRDALDGMARMVWTVAPPSSKPVLVTSKSEIRFASGARAFVLGADEVITGPSFTHAWVDDLALFDDAYEVWQRLRMCVRGGPGQTIVTAHPKAGAPGSGLLWMLVQNEADAITRTKAARSGRTS